MKKFTLLVVLAISLGIASCGKDENTMTLTTEINGLRKGTILLKKRTDSTAVVIDSIVVNGNDERFVFETSLPEPELHYLQLDKLDGRLTNDLLPFFAEKGIIEIHTTLEKFGVNYSVKGSKNHDLLEHYKKLMQPIQDRNLELIAETFRAEAAKDSAKVKELVAKSKSLQRNKYYRAVQFAINNKDHEIAAYIASTDIGDATTKLLDTINKSLSKPVKNSRYGKKLQALIDQNKTN